MVSFVGNGNIHIYKSRSVDFALAFTISDIIAFEMFDIQKLGQAHAVQFSRLLHSISNVRIYKCFTYFCASSHRSDILIFDIFNHQKRPGNGPQLTL